MAGNFEEWTVKQLRDECKGRHLSMKGTKTDLIRRLGGVVEEAEVPEDEVSGGDESGGERGRKRSRSVSPRVRKRQRSSSSDSGSNRPSTSKSQKKSRRVRKRAGTASESSSDSDSDRQESSKRRKRSRRHHKRRVSRSSDSSVDSSSSDSSGSEEDSARNRRLQRQKTERVKENLKKHADPILRATEKLEKSRKAIKKRMFRKAKRLLKQLSNILYGRLWEIRIANQYDWNVVNEVNAAGQIGGSKKKAKELSKAVARVAAQNRIKDNQAPNKQQKNSGGAQPFRANPSDQSRRSQGCYRCGSFEHFSYENKCRPEDAERYKNRFASKPDDARK